MSENGATQLTPQAMQIAWGQLVQCLGLVNQIVAIPIHQKSVDHSPLAKVLEFLVTNLAGVDHLKEINLAAHSIDRDRAVAQAWEQTI